MPRYNEYVFDYLVPIPGEEYSYPYSHPQAQTRLYSANPHMQPREPHRSPSQYVPHATNGSNIYISRPGPADHLNTSPIYFTHSQPHYQPPQFQTSSHQIINRSPTNSGAHYVEAPHYQQSSNMTDSSDESSSSPLSQSYECAHHTSVSRPKSRPQRYYCEFQDCIDKDTGKRRSLGRKADLKRHILTVHGEPKYNCPMPRCNRKGDEGFCRKDHMNEHFRTYHNKEVVTGKSRKNGKIEE